MSLAHTIEDRLNRSFRLYEDLVLLLPREALVSRLPGLRSNSIGMQLWCVVGARESYRVAIERNEWSGFSCSLEEPTRPGKVREALVRSAEAFREVLDNFPVRTETQNGFILDLVEHEAAHQGQLIRYLYGLNLTIPPSWKERFALED